MSLTYRLGAMLLLTSSLIAPAAALTPLGAMSLSAPSTQMRVSKDGRTLVTTLQGQGLGPSTLQVIDTSDPQQPRAAGALELSSTGEIELASGGGRALLHLSVSRPAYGQESMHEVIAVDLSDRSAPRILWQDRFSANRVVLSSQADVFAYSRLVAGKQSEWEVVVVSAVDHEQQVIVPQPLGSAAHMTLSPHGTHLAQLEYGTLRVWNLESTTPVFDDQPGLYSNRFLSSCTPIVLESGHVVVADARVPRLGVYQGVADMPRVATLRVDETSCNVLNPNADDRVFVVRDSLGRVSTLDLNDPLAPKTGASWQLPLGHHAFATARGLLFAAAADGAELRIYRMDTSTALSVDWSALETAHRLAMNVLVEKKNEGRGRGLWDATGVLEAAGVVQALAAPVHGISGPSAAAILNDYGFLASQSGRPPRIVESALRRAIGLDPRRALAHLNLADFLRDCLPRHAASGGSVSGRMEEIKSHYRAYLASGAKSSARATSYLRGDPGAGAKSDCEAIAMWTNAGRLQELVSDAGIDVPWKGSRIDLVFTTEGTAHVPAFYASDAADHPLPEGSMPELEAATENLWGGSNLGLVAVHGRYHVIQYKDWNHPVETTPLNGGQACRFEVVTRENVGSRASEPEMCRALQTRSMGATLAFNRESLVDPIEVRELWRETEIAGTRAVDFANSRELHHVAELQMSSSAGAGCGETFYDLLNADGSRLARRPQRDLLMKLQSATGENRYPVRCGNQPRFFSHRDLIYFESRPSTWPPTSDWDQYHVVNTVRNDRVVDVCDFRFRSSVSVPRSRSQ